jgi:REP element-mobilizing transposase RayT
MAGGPDCAATRFAGTAGTLDVARLLARERFRLPDAALGSGGRRSAPSLPTLDLPTNGPPNIFPCMDMPRRQSLPHNVPLWIDPSREIYFITLNCRERGRNQLARPEISDRLFETVRHRQEKFLWWPHVFLLMPDHLHALISFPPSGQPLRTVISQWKEWTAKQIGLGWQRDFFEHRLRHDESRRQKADYILENPVRQRLVARPEAWPFVYFADGERGQFDW